MIEKTEVKMDDLGRIVIPKQVRKKFSIERNEYLVLETDEEKIIIKKKETLEKYKKIIEKLEYINKKYKLPLIMMDNNEIIYTTDNYKKLLNKKIDKNLSIKEGLHYNDETKISKLDTLKEDHFYFEVTIDLNTKGYLFVITNETKKELVEVIYNLLK